MPLMLALGHGIRLNRWKLSMNVFTRDQAVFKCDCGMILSHKMSAIKSSGYTNIDPTMEASGFLNGASWTMRFCLKIFESSTCLLLKVLQASSLSRLSVCSSLLRRRIIQTEALGT